MNTVKTKLKRLALVTVAGMALTPAGGGAAASASEINNSDAEKVIQLPVVQEEFEQPDYLVKGIVHDAAQKILPLSIEARYYAPHFDMSVKSDKIFYNDGSVGLKDDLGFGDDKAPEVIFRYKRFTIDYIRIHGTGDRNFSGRNVLTFGGSRYHGNVHAENELHYLKLNITNPIFSAFGSGLDWSYGVTGMYWKGSVSGTDTSGRSESRSENFGVPLPTLGIGGHASLLPALNAYAHISGIYAGKYGHFYDFEAGIRYNPVDIFGIDVGFRRIHANVEHKNDSGKLTMNGPFAGLRFDF